MKNQIRLTTIYAITTGLLFLIAINSHSQTEEIRGLNVDLQRIENFENINNQPIPNLVGKVFHPDTIELHLDGTPYVLGNTQAINNSEKSGRIISQEVRNDLMLDGITPIDVVYARKNQQLPLNRNNRFIPEVLSRIPNEMAEIQKIRVPRLIDEPFDFERIKAMLNEIGLLPGDTISIIDNNRAGFVVRQYPMAETEVNRNTRINIAFAVSDFFVGESPEIIVVPEYRRQLIESVLPQLQTDKLSEGTIREIISEEMPGFIVSHFPEPGMEVDPFTPVNFEISVGMPEEDNQIVVPDLFGFSLKQVAEIFNEINLAPGKIDEEISLEKPGSVIQQNPLPGTLVKPGTKINLLIAINEQTQVEVPNVINLQKDIAILKLKNSGLVPTAISQKQENSVQNQVFNQFPNPGTLVNLGSEVNIFIPRSETQKNRLAIFWSFVVAVVIGSGIMLRKRKFKKKNKFTGEQNLKIDLKSHWDSGKQTIMITDTKPKIPAIKIKAKTDLGNQLIKTEKQ